MSAAPRTAYPSDVTDDEWAFCAPYPALVRADAPQRAHDLRAVLRAAAPAAAVFDGRVVQGTREGGGRAGSDGHKRRNGSKTRAAVDALGHLLAPRVTAASEPERAQVAALAAGVAAATGGTVEAAYADQGYTGERPAADAAAHGVRLEVVKHAGVRRGFVLLPRRWVVERSFAWAARFRRLARDYERLPATLAGLHWLAFACLMLRRLLSVVVGVHNTL